MANLYQIIDKLCPNGVEFKTLEDLGTFYSGLSGKVRMTSAMAMRNL